MIEPQDPDAPLRWHLAGASFVLALAIWMSSGTLAPYAATADHPVVLEPCHYLVNIDHWQFEGSYDFLSGGPSSDWSGSVVLRRILFPLFALPFMTPFGFLVGGVLASAVLNVAALAGFTCFIARYVGRRGAVSTCWLLATYPGITYWAGLPYSYTAIVPASLAAFWLLTVIDADTRSTDVVKHSLALGVVFLAYDLLPFFGAALVLLLGWRRRWRFATLAALAVVIPSALLATVLEVFFGVHPINSNTASYGNIIGAYFSIRPGWSVYLASLPRVLVSNFLFSNFLFIPLLFLIAMVAAKLLRMRAFMPPEAALLVAIFIVFLFNNAAPPYDGWQLRGEWIARLYQPSIAGLLVLIARLSENQRGRAWVTAVTLTILFNASIAFGGIASNPLASWMNYRFHIHSAPDALLKNVQTFGRRPLGFCRSDHALDELGRPAPADRPAYMYRKLEQR